MANTGFMAAAQGIRASAALRIGGVCLAIAALGWVASASPIEQFVHDLLAAADTRPGYAMCVIVMLMIAHNVFPIPAEAIAIAAGAMLGPLSGGLAVWGGAMLGASLAFWMSRVWGRSMILRFLPAVCASRLDRMAESCTWPALIGVRLVPIISFNLINYSAGLASVPWSTFLWTTAIGIIPVVAMSVSLGAGLFVLGTEIVIFGVTLLAACILARHFICGGVFRERITGEIKVRGRSTARRFPDITVTPFSSRSAGAASRPGRASTDPRRRERAAPSRRNR